MTRPLVSLLAAASCALTLALAPHAHAADAVPTEQDPVAQARAVKLSEQLRCLVCQNQTIAESNAELAVDLRRQVREQIAAGKSDDDIVKFMTDRYGDFVLYRPPLKATTLLLWGGPVLLLALGVFMLARLVRQRRAAPADAPLTAEERARAAALLAGTAKDKP
jgi:cytochrome c-type biogenesis protein CcmH